MLDIFWLKCILWMENCVCCIIVFFWFEFFFFWIGFFSVLVMCLFFCVEIVLIGVDGLFGEVLVFMGFFLLVCFVVVVLLIII